MIYCSFCGKDNHQVKKLIQGPTVFICNECVDLSSDDLCMDIICGRIAPRSSSADHSILDITRDTVREKNDKSD